MRQADYSRDFAAGVICNAGTLGILIPPSIVMVVYAAATDVSVGRMFIAGVVPGIIAGLMLMTGIYIAARVKKLPRQPWPGFRAIFNASLDRQSVRSGTSWSVRVDLGGRRIIKKKTNIKM